MKNIQLIQTETSDNLILNGLFKEVVNSKSVCIMIHGFTTDFYSHKFFHSIQDKLEESQISSITIQTRGTGMHTEFIKSGREDGINIGSFYEKLEEAHLDISSWIKMLTSLGYENIYLAGHSLGTIKTVRYLYEGEFKDKIQKIILLAPFDKNAYVENKTNGEWHEHVKIAKSKIENGDALEIIPDTFDDFPMTYQTYYSWYNQNDLSCMWDFFRGDNYNFPALNDIKIPTQIIVGDEDDDFFFERYNTLEQVKQILKNNIKNLNLSIVKGSGHTYVGFEEKVAELVANFLTDEFVWEVTPEYAEELERIENEEVPKGKSFKSTKELMKDLLKD